LAEGIQTFVKAFGGVAAVPASRHFENDLGIECEVYETSVTTEVAKLLDTSYYGVCIAWHDYAKKLCDQHSVDFDEAQTHYNQTYNNGYKELGKPTVVRPTLIPPAGSIGGHCVVQNAELLRVELDSKLLEAVTDLK
jgi:UDP-N-acetyl-D-mannosaminuronate dehydrogenase